MSRSPDAFAARTGSSACSSVRPQVKSVAGTPASACTSVRSSSASRQVSGSSASWYSGKFGLSVKSESASPTAAVSVS